MKSAWLALASFTLFFSSLALAAAPEHASVTLISDVSRTTPGSQFLGGVDFKLEKGWHVYWQNPGDYGEPPALKWKDHPDFEVGDIQWPTPEKIQVGTIVSFGYQDEVVLPFPITLAANFSGSSVEIEPQVKWLVCKDICVPGRATLKLTLPVASATDSARTENFSPAHPLFTAVSHRLPLAAPPQWQLIGSETKDDIILKIKNFRTTGDQFEIFPIGQDQVDERIATQVKTSRSEVEFKLRRSERLMNPLSEFSALLVFRNQRGESMAYTLHFPVGVKKTFSPGALFFPLFFALLGGLLLNLMPCVFPVLSIKAMSIVKMAGQHPREVKKMGWAYTAGILVSFWLLVGVLVFLRLGGQHLGWGFQLQSPQFVLVMACVLFAFGLNLLGVFEISGQFMGAGGELANQDGWVGSFFTGVLATLVATPCSAPFMGSAVGFALSQSNFIIFLTFTALGFGLALPYLLVCYLPKIGRFLPRPGAWMETFKQLMAFFIFGTILWLSWVLSLQVAPIGLVILLSAFLGIGFAAWWAYRFKTKMSSWIALALGLVFIFAAAMSLPKGNSALASVAGATASESSTNELTWEKFSPEKVVEYQKKGRPVFVDFTAAWCVSCQVNEALVFHSDAVKAKLKELNVALLKGDWTNQDPVITQTLASFDRDGVPFYLIYPKGEDVPAIPLPEVINAGLVLTELEKLK
jgi:thiol:disulfide interchange protein/DsbC/DsbD-like thiol-disulfide interchange protein